MPDLKELLTEAHKMGASQAQLDTIVERYNQKKSDVGNDSPDAPSTLNSFGGGSNPFQSSQVDTEIPTVLSEKAKLDNIRSKNIAGKFKVDTQLPESQLGYPIGKIGKTTIDVPLENKVFREFAAPTIQREFGVADIDVTQNKVGESLTRKGGFQDDIQATEYVPQEPTQEDVGYLESLKNSITNVGVGLQQFIPNTQIALEGTLKTLLGKDLGTDAYWQLTKGDPELHRAESYQKLAELEPQFKQTRGLVESGQNFDVFGLAVATVDAGLSLVRTMVTSVPTAGLGLYSDMVGGSVASYNQEKAKQMGLSVRELYDRGENDFVVPATIGTIAAQMEKIGLKGVSNAINKKLVGSWLKKTAVFGVEVNKEGLTELVQTGLDEANKSLAQGKGAVQSSKDAASAMLSKKGLESYLMGVVGSAGAAGAAGAGRIAKSMISPKAKEKVQAQTETIERLKTELENPNLSPTAQEFVAAQIQTSVADVATEVETDATLYENLSTEQKKEADRLNGEIEKSETVINDPALSEETKAAAVVENERLNTELEAKLNEKSAEVKTPKVDTPAKTVDVAKVAPMSYTEDSAEQITNIVNSIPDIKTTEGLLNSTKGTHYEALAKALGGYLQNIKTSIVPKLIDKFGIREHGGLFEDGVIKLKKGEGITTFLHEALHAVTSAKLLAWTRFNQLNRYNLEGGKPQQSFKELGLHDLSKKDIEAIKNLERIYEESKLKAHEFLGGGKADRTKGFYGFTNIDEFISEAFTSKEFQTLLKNIKGEGKTSNLFKDFLDSLAKLLDIKDPTILDDIFYHTEVLMDGKKQTQVKDSAEQITKEAKQAEAEMAKNNDPAEFEIKMEALDKRAQALPKTGEVISEIKNTIEDEQAITISPNAKELQSKANNNEESVVRNEAGTTSNATETVTREVKPTAEVAKPERTGDATENEIKMEALDKRAQALPKTEAEVGALKDVESTAKALDSVELGDKFKSQDTESVLDRNNFYRKAQEMFVESKGLTNDEVFNKNKQKGELTTEKGRIAFQKEFEKWTETNKKQIISEAYHSDKASGKETELTKAVESLLKEQPTEPIQSKAEQTTPAATAAAPATTATTDPLLKAEDDLKSLSKSSDKQTKYAASVKRLIEAKKDRQITEKEFNDMFKRFGDVLAADKKAGDILRKLADKIDQGRINKLGGMRGGTGYDLMWDGSLTIASASLRATADIVDVSVRIAIAIEAGLAHARKSDWYKSLNNKPKFEAAYTAHLEKEFGKQLADDVVTPEKETPTQEAPTQEDRKELKRAATQRALDSDQYGQGFKDALSYKAIHYTELPNQVTEQEAEALIEIQGEVGIERDLYDFNNGMPSAVRFSVLQKLIDIYEAKGDNLKAGELAEELYSKATDYGQGIQIFSTFPKLSKATNVAIARKTVKTNRDVVAKRAKPTTDKLTKEFKKANKEAAEETVEAVKKSIGKATLQKGASLTDLPLGYGMKNKVFTRAKYLKAKQNLRGATFSFAGGIPIEDLVNIAGYHIEATGKDFTKFTRRMKADLGAKIKPYLKDIYAKSRESLIEGGYDPALFLTDEQVAEQINAEDGQVYKEKLDKAIKRKSAKEQKQAIAKLQQISKEEGLWGQYSNSAASRLKSMVKPNIQADIAGQPSLQQFTDGLVRNMKQKMAESMPEQTKKRAAPRSAIDIIGDAYSNFEKYKDVWVKTQKEFQEEFADQPEILEAIDAYFGEILETPFSDRVLESAVRKGLKDMDKTITDLVVQHYTLVDHARESLSDKLVNEAGLSGAEAKQLAYEIERKFDEIATKKKQQILERMFSAKTKRTPQGKALEDGIVKMTNLGGFSNADIVEMYAEKMGWPKLTQENIAEIELLSDIIQNTKDPINRRRATEDLLAYQANLKGISALDMATAIWYANVLSGYNTQIINIGANAINTSLLYANAVAQNPTNAAFIGRGLMQGLKRGWLESKDTLRTGYSPIKGKPEIPSLLERMDFKGGQWNPANYLKHVRRVMVAADVLFFEGQKEMRAYQMAMKQAMREGKDVPTLDQQNRAIELVGRSAGQLQAIQDKYQAEYAEDLERIEGQDELTPAEKKELLGILKADTQRKIFDAVERQRSAEMVEDAVKYASEGTYNYQPKGTLGAVANFINQLVQDVPILRYAVPFTNIIANVANETINYTPLAFTRLNRGGWSKFRRDTLSQQDRADLMTKAIIGTTLMVTLMALSQSGEDDEPIIEITANGTGDYAKNETLKLGGWHPYSFRIKLPSGNYSPWYSYQYSPLMASLGFVGHFNDLQKYKGGDSELGVVARLSAAAGLTATSIFQATFLTGVGDMLAALLDPRSSEGLIDKMARGAVNAARGVAIPNLLTQTSQDLERIFDVPKKETRPVKDGTVSDYAKSLIARTVQDAPYARNMYYDKINILGDPILYDTDKFESANIPNRIIELLVDKKAVFAPMSRNEQKIYDVDKEVERALNDQEFYEYAKVKGAFIKNALTEGYKDGGKTYLYEDFTKMSEDKFKSVLSKIKRNATLEAKASTGGVPSEVMTIQEDIDNEWQLSPKQIKERIRLNKEYVENNESILITDTEAYIREEGLTPAQARAKALKDLWREANSKSKDILLADPTFKENATIK